MDPRRLDLIDTPLRGRKLSRRWAVYSGRRNPSARRDERQLFVKALYRSFDIRLSDQGELEIGHAKAFACVRREAILVSGADRVAAELNDLGIRMTVVTSGWRDAQGYIDRLNLMPSTVCITREKEGHSKPASDQLHRALKELRVDARDAAMVGDSTWDVLSSRIAGSLKLVC